MLCALGSCVILANKILTLKLSSLWSYHVGLGGFAGRSYAKKSCWGDDLWASRVGVFDSPTYHYNFLALAGRFHFSEPVFLPNGSYMGVC